MIEREQGRGHRVEERVVEDRGVASDAAVERWSASDEEAQAVRHARFLAALDKVMADHHDVLAALAK